VRILVDTNILISALLYPDSTPAKALFQVAKDHEMILTDYNIAEFRRIASTKFHMVLPDIELFLAKLDFSLVLAPHAPQKLITDPKDAPILNAAIIEDVDIIISGDKHFLSLGLKRPKVLRASDFIVD